ncbi:4-(cytidine 5'-diphospho)-2-C-methyl-D-erythritol kinase [Bordetella ansorpii]|uniref:4-(cytidine 5'-diphospho)-2-C-methyl-D-erythritol kinase n=1 Tax=Bordetella ansorpii TaxID=288768 RepID=UPI00082421E0|nr:4-(cytidine 5'-diphospho)-2-C-methyl-D-erythritol kinase [Bordetella ansorpii]
MTLYDVPAPAKINLFLHVVGRRPGDGYHLLQTVFRFVDLCDTLHFEARADGQVTRAYDLPGVPPEQDLTVRAARALQQATGTRAGAQIGLEKRIPQGGGLGGGSSDAATTLIALNRLWNTGLSRAELMALALPLGADVPVFVFGQSAFAEGVGEQLSAVTLPPAAYVLAQPDASVPTVEIFRAPDLTRDSSSIRMADFLADPTSAFGRNDLEPAVFRRYPRIEESADWLKSRLKVQLQDRTCVNVRMSGSGACLYAEFSTLQQAVLAEKEITATMRVAGKTTSPAHPEFRLIKASAGLVEHPLRYWIAR